MRESASRPAAVLASPRGALRALTAEAHGVAEDALGLLAPGLTPARYAAALDALHGFHAALETRLAAAVAAGHLEGGLVGAARSTDLARDLHALGISPPAGAPCPLPVLADADAALAGAYVLGGSALGARLLQRRLPHTVTGGARTYVERGCGPAALARWRVVEAALAALAARQVRHVAATAVALFDGLARHAVEGRCAPARG